MNFVCYFLVAHAVMRYKNADLPPHAARIAHVHLNDVIPVASKHSVTSHRIAASGVTHHGECGKRAHFLNSLIASCQQRLNSVSEFCCEAGLGDFRYGRSASEPWQVIRVGRKARAAHVFDCEFAEPRTPRPTIAPNSSRLVGIGFKTINSVEP